MTEHIGNVILIVRYMLRAELERMKIKSWARKSRVEVFQEGYLHGSHVGLTETNSSESPVKVHDVIILLDEVVGDAQTVLT